MFGFDLGELCFLVVILMIIFAVCGQSLLAITGVGRILGRWLK